MSNAAFTLETSDISFTGDNLSRPECVLAQQDGTLWISDNRGGVTKRAPDGTQTIIGKIPGVPNGFAMDRKGDLYVANMETCTLDRLTRDGRHETLFDETPGAVNFAYCDPHKARVWVTVSTLSRPIGEAARHPRPDGSVLLYENGRARCVASSICFANEVRVDAAGEWLYVAETAKGRVLRYRIAADGALSSREVFGPAKLRDDAVIDGIAFDAAGNLWITELTRNSIWLITPEGRRHLVFEDPPGAVLQWPTSIAFGGPDLRTAYLGSLTMKKLATFRVPEPGAAMVHWKV